MSVDPDALAPQSSAALERGAEEQLIRTEAPRGLDSIEDRVESRAMMRETVGAFGLLGTALAGLGLALTLEPGFLMKVTFALSGAALWTCALVAVWPRTRRFASKMNRIACPECGTCYRVTLEEILADAGSVRPSRHRSPSGFTCYEVMCRTCGVAHRFRRSGKLVAKAEWLRDGGMEDRARRVAERAVEALDDGDVASLWRPPRMFWDGGVYSREEWIAEVSRGRACLGRPRERRNPPAVHWSNHPDGIAYVHYLEERDVVNDETSPFSCEDYVSFTWTTVYAGVVANECVILGLYQGTWTVLGYRIDGVADFVQLDGVGRLSIPETGERGALSPSDP